MIGSAGLVLFFADHLPLARFLMVADQFFNAGGQVKPAIDAPSSRALQMEKIYIAAWQHIDGALHVHGAAFSIVMDNIDGYA